LPYSWNSNSYTAAGTYSVTLTSTAGCDSAATLNLSVNPVLASTTNAAVCSNQLPYNWNGNSYTSAGTYNVTLTSSSGCDSVATLNLSVNPVLTSTTNSAICSNQLPYSWNGNTYTSAGTYNVTLTSTSGCDSVATLNLSVNPVLASTTNTAICSNQLPYTWNGNSYSSAGTYSVTLTSTSGCDSVATLNLFVNPVLASTTNAAVCSNQLPYNWNGNSYTGAGTYNVTLTSSSGCDSVATLNLSVNPVLTSTTNTSVCSNQLPYSWNGNSYTGAGTYNVTLTSTAGCDSVATLNLSVNPVLASTTNTSVCSNQLPYSWNGNSYTSAGAYNVTLTSSSGCDSVATLNLSVNPVLASTTNTAICSNQLPYNWNGNSYTSAGTYNVTLTSTSDCDSVATLNLSVNLVLASTTNTAICSSQLPYSWNGNSYTGAGTYNVTLASTSGCDSVATLNLSVNPVLTSTTNTAICSNQLPYSWNGNSYTSAGTYNVTMTSTSGCDSAATLNLSVNPVLASTTNAAVCSNQLPYSWNGNTYTSAGTYNVTLTSTSGCDSVATLNLSVNPVLTSITNISVCSNQLPYSWNGNSYTSAGTYNVTLTSTSGCDSVATLNLSVSPMLASTTNADVCSNQLPYSWNGNTYTSAGTYNVTLTSTSGCDSVATLNLSVNPVLSSTTNTSICSNQLPYSWNGNSYNAAGTYNVTLTSSSGCDSVATLNLSVNAVLTSTTTTFVCSNQLPYSWNGNSYTSAGTYNVTLTSTAGCDSVATLNLSVNPVLASTTNAAVCSNQLPYNWNGNSYTSAGTYNVTLTSSSGCDSVATLNLSVNPVLTSISNTAICSNQLPYSWNGNSYTSAGTYNVTLTSSSGCDSVATLNLAVTASPSAPIVQNKSVCQFENVSLTVTATYPLTWYTVSTGGVGSSSPPIVNTTVPGLITFYVSQRNAACESPRTPLIVTVNPKPSLGPDKALSICYGNSKNLGTEFSSTGSANSWTLNGLNIPAPTAANSSGVYQLITSNSSGCADTARVSLTVQPKIVANAGPDRDEEYMAAFQLNGSGGINYSWSPASVLNNSFIQNPTAILQADTEFALTVSDAAGCSDTDSVKIRVLKGPAIYLPNAFTPNSDGLNDVFKPTGVGMTRLDHFRIFNRYGQVIFESNDPNKGWDGTYKGVAQNSGNYVWSLKATDRTGKVRSMQGYVLLIR